MEYVGRKEYIQLPTLGKAWIAAKVDTGAYRTAVHCLHCEEVHTNKGKALKALFNHDGKGECEIIFNEYTEKLIRSSFGDSELRYCVKMTLKIGNKRIRSEVSLTDRSDMRYQVLIGRKTLRKKFVVDVSRQFIAHHA
jgi:hypothetical protein